MHKEICKVPRNSIFSGFRFDLKHRGVTVWLLWKQWRGPSLPAAKSISSDDQRWKIAFEGCQKISCVSLRSVRVRARVCAKSVHAAFLSKKINDHTGHEIVLELHPINSFNQLCGFV